MAHLSKLNRATYKRLIREDLAALERLPESLERTHIEHVLYWSIEALYREEISHNVESLPNRSEYADQSTSFGKALERLARTTEWATETGLRGPRPPASTCQSCAAPTCQNCGRPMPGTICEFCWKQPLAWALDRAPFGAFLCRLFHRPWRSRTYDGWLVCHKCSRAHGQVIVRAAPPGGGA